MMLLYLEQTDVERKTPNCLIEKSDNQLATCLVLVFQFTASYSR